MLHGMRQNQGPAQTDPAPAAGEPAVAQKRTNGVGAFFKNPLVLGAAVVLVAIGLFFGIRYVQDMESKISIETAELSTTVISIGPETSGTLKALYVKEGDRVAAGQQLFTVGDRVTTAHTPGVVISVQNAPGQWESQQNVIVQMYDPTSLRVVGHLQEDQGLSDVRVGQKVEFTVDAFGSQPFAGIVESVARTADQASLAFSISDKRPEKQFSVKVAFDVNAYPELRNGMSARMYIYK